jgi:predicted nucleic acid-binding protein
MMTRQAFIDTAGWASLFIRSEQHYVLARATFDEWRRNGFALVTTNYVLAELVALLTSPLRLPRAQQFQFIDTIRATPYIQVIHIDSEIDAAAWALLKARADKVWSLVDATSFVIMSERGITEALTTDRHFEQAGFIRLLRD